MPPLPITQPIKRLKELPDALLRLNPRWVRRRISMR